MSPCARLSCLRSDEAAACTDSPASRSSFAQVGEISPQLQAESAAAGRFADAAEALDLVERFVEHYNRVRLHSALGDVTPQAVRQGKEGTWAERDRRMEAARELRSQRRAGLRQPAISDSALSSTMRRFEAGGHRRIKRKNESSRIKGRGG